MFDATLFKKLTDSRVPIIVLESVDSTNTYAVSHDLAPFTVVLAETQTGGRGRSGRKWVSEPYVNIYFSIVLSGITADKLLPMNIFSGYVLSDTLKPYLDAKVKWPNDVVAGGKKLAGILMETSFSGGRLEKAVVGIGVNINQKNFPDEIKDKATSVFAESGIENQREEILASFMINFVNRYDEFIKNEVDIAALWSYYSAFQGKKISVHKDGVKTDFIEKGIDSSGCLLAVNSEGRLETVITGDVGL